MPVLFPLTGQRSPEHATEDQRTMHQWITWRLRVSTPFPTDETVYQSAPSACTLVRGVWFYIHTFVRAYIIPSVCSLALPQCMLCCSSLQGMCVCRETPEMVAITHWTSVYVSTSLYTVYGHRNTKHWSTVDFTMASGFH